MVDARWLALNLLNTMADIILPERIPYGGWVRGITVGVVGGLAEFNSRPVYNDNGDGVTEDLEDLPNDDSEDVFAAVQAVINACPLGEKVMMPEGIFRLDTNLVGGTAFSGRTFGGQGKNLTIFKPRTNVGMLFGSQSGYFNPTVNPLRIGTGPVKGATSITVEDGPDMSFIVPGMMIKLQFSNKTNPLMIAVYLYNENSGTAISNQVVRVESVVGRTITFVPPVAYDQSHGPARISVQSSSAYGIGLEGFTVDMEEYEPSGPGSGAFVAVRFDQIYGGFVKNLKCRRSYNYGLAMADSLHCEVFGLTAGELKGSGTNGAGFLGAIYNTIVENSCFMDAVPGWEINNGATQNVFNYCAMNGAANINHSPQNAGNLYTNIVGAYLICDGYFGGQWNAVIINCDFYLYGINLRRWNRYTTVGNCVGPTDIYPGFPFIVTNAYLDEAYSEMGQPSRDQGMYAVLDTRHSDTDITVYLPRPTDILHIDAAGHLHRCYFYYGTDNENGIIGDQTAWDPIERKARFNIIAGTVPAAGTTFGVVGPGSYDGGDDGIVNATFHELDLGVGATLVKKGMYIRDTATTIGMDGDTLTDPFNTTRPDFLEVGDAWPILDYTAPVSTATTLALFPAGREYLAFVPPVAPGITGSPGLSYESTSIGSPITALPAPTTGTPPATSSFQWQKDDGGISDIVGAVGTEYPNLDTALEGIPIRVAQTAANGVSPDAVAYSAWVTILPFMGDRLIVTKTANPTNLPIIELVRRGPAPNGPCVDTKISHTGDYPADPPNDMVHAPVNGSGDNSMWWVDPTEDYTLPQLVARRNIDDPL